MCRFMPLHAYCMLQLLRSHQVQLNEDKESTAVRLWAVGHQGWTLLRPPPMILTVLAARVVA